jgi:hypothetical protein
MSFMVAASAIIAVLLVADEVEANVVPMYVAVESS